jgi:hypothetical protein
MTRDFKRLWRVLIVAIVPVVILAAVFIAFLNKCTYVQVAVSYGPLSFHGTNGHYSYAHAYTQPECMLFFDLPSHGPTSIDAISEAMWEDDFVCEERQDWRAKESGDRVGRFQFRNGRLREMDWYGEGIAFSNSKDGIYLTLPVSEARLVEVFGRPDIQHRNRRMNHISYH